MQSVDAYHILKYVADAHELQAVEDLSRFLFISIFVINYLVLLSSLQNYIYRKAMC